jgi:hypothetical protein
VEIEERVKKKGVLEREDKKEENYKLQSIKMLPQQKTKEEKRSSQNASPILLPCRQ